MLHRINTGRLSLRAPRGFTIVEMMVIIGIVGLLAALLFPAVGAARTQAMETVSKSNLRQIGQASAAYAVAWKDRQWTVVDDNLAIYGNSIESAVANFGSQAQPHAPIVAGFGAGGVQWGIYFDDPANAPHLMPINFDGPLEYGGWFRYLTFKPFHDYLGGRYFHPIFWAPKDTIPLSEIEGCFDIPLEFDRCGRQTETFPRSSYSMSAAALFSPDVFRSPEDGGWQDPFDDDLATGLKVPALALVRYGALKTHVLEHHWLQNAHQPCNPNFGGGYGCEPYYFNQGIESVPMTLFYDGHVEGLGVSEAQLADARQSNQTGYGLWSRDTPWGSDGYLIGDGWDFLVNTSFHILTTEGIRGRDTIRKE